MREVPLYSRAKLNLVALVDDADYERVCDLRWTALRSLHTSYVIHNSVECLARFGRRYLLMHRFLLSDVPSSVKIDHWNRNGLDNQRHNLRVCNHSQNCANRPKQLNNTTGFKGVYRASRSAGFVSYISFAGEIHYLGAFLDPVEAARAYDRAAFAQWGQFAYLNFPKT